MTPGEPIPHVVSARAVTAWQVVCPECRHLTTWADGLSADLDGSTVQCSHCRVRMIVLTERSLR